MKNTLENKAKFFAQYWGQTFIYTGEGRPMRKLPKRFVLNYESCDRLQLLLFSNQRSVELKPLSQLKDEDAIEVAQIVSGNRFKEPINKGMVDFWNYVYDNDSKLELRIQLQPTKLIPANTFHLVRVLTHSVYVEYGNISDGVDFLRSKGYALPYNGLSVEKQIEYGWIKLTTSTKITEN